MLSYQHGYHAGNFADVVKHLTLTRLIHYLIQKDKPLFYLETHGGKGLYDLQDKQAQKNREFNTGVAQLWQQQASLGPLFSPWLEAIAHYNPAGPLKHYPGSPAFALQGLRPCDRLYVCELHPQEYDSLRKLPAEGKKLHTAHCDGLEQLIALMPPLEKRGLILLDPAYEIKKEYSQIPKAIAKAWHKFSTGVFALWYPLVDDYHCNQLRRGMTAIGAEKALQVEFDYTFQKEGGMTGCGLWILNPPYRLADELRQILQELTQKLNPGRSSFRIDEINGTP